MFLLQEAFHCRLMETKGARGLRNNKAPFPRNALYQSDLVFNNPQVKKQCLE